MAYFNRNNQGYQQRDNSSNNQGWFPNSQEVKRGETAPTEKGRREKVAVNNQQNAQLMHISAVAAAQGFQLSNTTNLKEAIGKFKSSPYYSSVVNQQNQKKQQQQHHHQQQQNQHQSNQGIDFAKMTKKEHIQQISRIYQNNPTNILNSVQHNGNNVQSGGGTTTNKKATTNMHPLDPYSSNNIPPQRYSFKLPQRPSTSHDQQTVQRKQYQVQGTTQYRNTQMSITNTDGFGLKKPQTPGTGTRIATAGTRGSKMLNTSGNSLLNSSLNNGTSSKGQQQHLNVLHPLQVRNTSVGVNASNNIKRRDTFSTNNNHNNTSFNKDASDLHKNQHDDLLPHYNTHQGDAKQNFQQEQKSGSEQYPSHHTAIKVHHADFKKEQSAKQNFFTHENFYSQGSTSSQRQENYDKRVTLNKSGQGNTFLNESFSNKPPNAKPQQHLLKLTLPQQGINNAKQHGNQQNIQDDTSEGNTPRIIVTGNQEQQSHKIQFIENSFTKYGDEEDETTAENKQRRAKQRNKVSEQNNEYNSSDQKKQRKSHDHEEEGDDEHEDDQEEDEEDYHNYYNSNEQEDNEYRQQYAVPYDEDDEDEDYDDDDEQEDEEDDAEGHEDYHHQEQGQEMNDHFQYYHNQQHEQHQNRQDFSDDNQVQNFIQDVDDEYQCRNNDEEDQFGEQNIQKYMREKMQNQKDQMKISSKPMSTRPMTTEGGKRKRGAETPVQNQSKQGERKDSKEQIQNVQVSKQDNFDFTSQVNRRQSQKENFNLCVEEQNDSSNEDQYGQEFRIDFDTQQFERPPERGKQYMGNRGPVKVDHDLIKEDSLFKESSGPGKRPPSRHRIPNRAAGLGIPTQDLQDIPIKNMYDKDEGDDNVNDQNRKFFEGQKLQIEKIKQSQDSEDAFMNFDFRNFGDSQSRKNSSRQPPIPPKVIYNDRPQSGNVKTRALNKKESFDEGVHSHLPERVNQNNIQNLKLPSHPVSAKYPKKNSSIHQKENDQLWDEFDDILNDKQGQKNIIRKLEGSDILIKHNVSSTMNSKISSNTSQSVKLPFETSLGQDFLSLFANNFNEH